MRNRFSILICVVLGFLCFVIPVRSQVPLRYTVRNTSDVVVPGACGNGLGGSTIDCSLRGAIQAVNAGGSGVIFFSIPLTDPNCSFGSCTIDLTSPLPSLFSSNTSINGPGADKLLVRRGTAGSFRIFTVTADGTVNISGMFISNGLANAGAGIFHNGIGTLNVTNCNLSNHTASSSTGGHGGAIANACCGTLNVVNSTLSNNVGTGDSGGGGGGIYNEGTLNVTNSTLRDNRCGAAATTSGGAIRNVNGTVKVTNSTIALNSCLGSPGHGGGIYSSGGTVTVKSSIVALNSATTAGPDLSGSFVSAGFNIVGKTDGSAGITASTDLTGTVAAPFNPMLDLTGVQNNGGPIETMALLLGSPAIDKGTSSGLTGTLIFDQRGGIYRRRFDSPSIINAVGGDGTDIGAFELQSHSPADFDGDNKTDVGIFRPSLGEWWSYRSSNGATFATQFGQSTDRITPSDFTGDGKADIAFWRPANGFWFILRSENFTFFSFPFGSTGDIPAPADFDSGGVIDEGVFRPSTGTWFYIRSFDDSVIIVQFGANGDIPVPGDYDGDGVADVAIFRPSAGQWWINRSTGGVFATTFGSPSDKPVQGDYTGDGKTDIAFWRPSTGEWFVLRSEDFSFFSFVFGTGGDIPAPGDYDGDGKFDATIFRPSTSTWFSNRTNAGTLIQQFGVNGDRPIPSAFVP